jgi:parallel beta-helix repeat protein
MALLILAALAGATLGGPLDPPGAPAPTDGVRPPGTPIDGQTTITTPGRYYLTRSLNVASGNGITIGSDNVDLDLNGFRISTQAGASGSAIGIANSARFVRVSNGATAFFNVGVMGGDDWTVENMRIIASGPTAIQLQARAVVRGCGVFDAVILGDGGVIEDCTVNGAAITAGDHASLRNVRVIAAAATAMAINLQDNATIDGCSVQGGTTAGIKALMHASIRNCDVGNGGGAGIDVGDSSVVELSRVYGNGGGGIVGLLQVSVRNCTVSANTGNGISLSGRSEVLDSVVKDNTGDGIQIAGFSVVERNVVTANGLDGIQMSVGVHVLNNTASGNGELTSLATEGAGIRTTSSNNLIHGNLLRLNDFGVVTSGTASGSTVIGNSAQNNGAGPDDNFVLTGTADVAGPELDGTSVDTATNPYANFSLWVP